MLDDKGERTPEVETLGSNEFECEICSQDALSFSQLESEEDSSDEAEETEPDEQPGFAFSSAPLSFNRNITAHNASMALFGVVARHCLSDEALYELVKWRKIVHPQDKLPAPNLKKTREEN